MPPITSLNKNNTAVKRIMQEARELANDPCTDYHAAPLEDDIFEWHCTMRGPSGTEFEGGLYHFRILLPAEYPFRPPSLMILTPNGRFELNTKICISFTNYHEEEWQPAWGVRTAILGLQGFFPLKGQAANGVGSVEYPVSERKRLALLRVFILAVVLNNSDNLALYFSSREWVCPRCQQTNLDCLPDPAQQAASTLNQLKQLRGLSCTEDQTEPPVIRPASPLPTAPERSSAPETSTLGLFAPDSPVSSTRSAEPEIPITQDQESSVGSHTEAIRGSPQTLHHRSHRPPLLLDTAICVLLVLVVALLCRRVL
ncbi:UBC-like protein [Gyrodon lividus]|nr:UBC-like protein [Gyrodon lividus]